MSLLSTCILLLLSQLPAPPSTQGLPTCHPFSAAAISRVPGSLLISPTCVPGHLPPPLVPDPHIQSPPRSHPPPVPQAPNTKPVPGLLPQWVTPSTTLPRCHLGQFYLTKAHLGLSGPSLQPQPHRLPRFHQPPVLSQAWDPPHGAEARSVPAVMAPGDTAQGLAQRKGTGETCWPRAPTKASWEHRDEASTLALHTRRCLAARERADPRAWTGLAVGRGQADLRQGR